MHQVIINLWTFIILFILFFIFFFFLSLLVIFKRIKNQQIVSPKKITSASSLYEVKQYMSDGERRFHHVLLKLFKTYPEKFKGLDLEKQVRLSNIIKNVSTDWDREITLRSIDFALIEHNSSIPRLVIELDDSSHNQSNRIQRDVVVDDILRQANIPIVHIKVVRDYNIDEIYSLLVSKITQ